MSASNSNYDEVCIRILCLHGKGGNGDQFVNSSLLPLRSMVEKRLEDQCIDGIEHTFSFQWEALTAPYEMSSDGNEWWKLPQGVRSFNAKEVRDC